MVLITKRIASEIKDYGQTGALPQNFCSERAKKPVPHDGSLVGSQNFGIVSSNCAYGDSLTSVTWRLW
jgi:hypothetical protein